MRTELRSLAPAKIGLHGQPAVLSRSFGTSSRVHRLFENTAERGEEVVKIPFLFLLLLASMGPGGLGCHVDQETSSTGSGSETSQVIKFENITQNIPVLVRIPDANQEFELAVGETKTVEVHSEEGAAVFFVEIFQNRPNQDISVAPRWTGFVEVGKVVTIRQRITIQPEIHD